VSEDAAGAAGKSPTGPQARAESKADRCDRLLRELRDAVLEIIWNDKIKVEGLLNDATLNPIDYDLEGGAHTLWANLIPILKSRREFSSVLKRVQPRVGQSWGETTAELANYFEAEEKRLEYQENYDRKRTDFAGDMEDALERLRDAHSQQTALLMPDHPNAARIAGMRGWLTGCAKAVGKARRSAAEVAHDDEAAQIDELATALAVVADAFHMYVSNLERFRRANEAGLGQPPRPLAAMAEEEKLLLGWRASLRDSIQELIKTVRTEQ
jgi:hypothetical protein